MDAPEPEDHNASETVASRSPSRWLHWRATFVRLRKPILVFAGVGTVLGGLAGYLNAWRTVSGTPAAQVPASSPIPVTAPAEVMSILVLPLANQTGDPLRTHVAEGLTAAITSDLSRLSTAAVAPPQTARVLAEKKLTLAELGQQGRARFVLSGTVVANGDDVRIDLQLSDTQDGTQRWANTFTGSLTDLFALQDEITMRVRLAIEPRMVVIAANEAEKRRQTPGVADLLLQAQAMQLQPRLDWTQIIALCRRVLALEPDNPLAMKILAATLVTQNLNQAEGLGLTPAQVTARYSEAGLLARRVLSTDASDSRMYNVLSWEAADLDDQTARRRYLAQALAMNPYNNATLSNLGDLEAELGNNEQAYRYYAQAADVPLYNPNIWYLGRMSLMALRLQSADRALEAAQRAVDADPQNDYGYLPLALAYGLKGDSERARRAAAEFRRLNPTFESISLPPPWPGKETEFAYYVEQVLKPAAERAGLPVMAPASRTTR